MRRSFVVAFVAIALHTMLAHLLDRAAIVERMLSPGGDDALPAAGITIAFMLLRLGMLFVLPGWLLARLVLARITVTRPNGARPRPAPPSR